MQSQTMSPPANPPPPPPWEVLVLVSHRLDPKSLAAASCVCRSWSAFMSSDYLWEPLCSSHYPSLRCLRSADPSVPFHRLFSMGLTASKRRNRSPPPPRLSLDSLDFVIDIRGPGILPMSTLARCGEDLKLDLGPNNLFKFDIENPTPDGLAITEASCVVRVTWNVVVKGYKGGVFTVMDCDTNVSLIPGAEGWFSQEMPSPPGGWWMSGGTSGVVADVKVVFGGRRVEKASVGMLSALSWRYLSVDDGLRYLQHFLDPN